MPSSGSVAVSVSSSPGRNYLISSLEAAFQAIPDGLIVCDASGCRANVAARRLLALPDDAEFDVARISFATLTGDVVARDELPDAVARQSGQSEDFTLRGHRFDGVERIFEGTVSPIPGRQDRGSTGAVWVLRDVTREHNRELLKELFFEDLLEALPIAVVVSDPATHEVLTANRAFFDLGQFSGELVLGATPPHPWWAEAENCLAEPHGGGSPMRIEARFRQAQGNLIPVEVVRLPVRGADGKPAAEAALITDLTERRKLERQLVQSGKLAALGELAAGVAHEINNPLFAILGIVEFLLLDAEPGTRSRERLELIQQTGLEIKEIVKALLDFARERPDEQTLVSLDDVARDTLELVRRATMVKDVEIVENLTGGPFTILGSANQLKQVFLNLVSNAQQAMPEGGTVAIELARDDGWVRASVTDTGSGIDEEKQERVFEPFFTTKRDLGAAGLGLSVSLGIAHMHGGDLTVASTPGEGARFTLSLPLASSDQDPA